MSDFDDPPARFTNRDYRARLVDILAKGDLDIADGKEKAEPAYLNGRTEYQVTKCWDDFTSYMELALKRDKSTTPTADDIQNFIRSLVQLAIPFTGSNPESSDAHLPTYGFVKGVKNMTIQSCKARYGDFKYTEQDSIQMKYFLNRMLKDGSITQQPKLDRNWAGTIVVEFLVRSMISTALKSGTLSWDTLMSSVASLVLLAALACRGGDITKGWFDEHESPYLKYGDVSIRFQEDKTGKSVNDLLAVIVIRNEKGKKYDPSRNRQVLLLAQQDPKLSVLDPIKLILVMALRTGNVSHSNIDDLLESTYAKRNRTVKWKFPDRPVLAMFGQNSSSLLIDEPAGPLQLNKMLDRECSRVGLLKTFTSHDFRRGQFRETAHLDAPAKGIVSLAAVKRGGHRLRPADFSRTDDYVGDPDDDMWSKILKERTHDRIYPVFIAVDTYQPTRATRDEIAELCRRQGLDEDEDRHRKHVAQHLRKRKVHEWASGTSAKAHAFTDDQDRPRRSEHPVDDSSDDSDDDEVQGTLLLADVAANLAPETELAGNEFVRRFSKINLSNTAQFYKRQITIAANTGNSRDPMTAFPRPCKNAHFGCPYAHDNRNLLAAHEKLCKYVSPGLFPVSCTSCSDRFADDNQMQKHRNKIHKGYPKPCSLAGCFTMLQDARDKENHVANVHNAIQPTQCEFPGCVSKAVFNNTVRYNRHLRETHGLSPQERKEYCD